MERPAQPCCTVAGTLATLAGSLRYLATQTDAFPSQETSSDDGSVTAAHGLAAAEDLRVVSLNVWNSFFLGGPARAKRLRTLIRALCEGYDVVLLQEAFAFTVAGRRDAREVDRLRAGLAKGGLAYQTKPCGGGGYGQDAMSKPLS